MSSAPVIAPPERPSLPLLPPPEIAPARGASRSSAAARKHLIRAAAFFALLAVCAIALHGIIHLGLRRITTSTFGASNRVFDGRVNADILITGSSRAMVHYDPRIIAAATGQRTFNLGRNGSQTDLQVAVLASYLEHNAAPHLLIHNLDLYSFVSSREIYDPAQYLPYLADEPLYRVVRQVYPDAWKWKYVPLYGYVVPDMRFTWLLGLKRLAGFNPPEDQIDGFVPRPWSWSDDFEKFRREHPHGYRTAIEPAGVHALEELLRLCRDRGIPVLLVYSPEYAEIQPLQVNRRQIFARFAELGARFHAPLWDFSDSDLARTRAYFYNSQHLNAEGAAAFSQALAQRLAASDLIATTSRHRD